MQFGKTSLNRALGVGLSAAAAALFTACASTDVPVTAPAPAPHIAPAQAHQPVPPAAATPAGALTPTAPAAAPSGEVAPSNAHSDAATTQYAAEAQAKMAADTAAAAQAMDQAAKEAHEAAALPVHTANPTAAANSAGGFQVKLTKDPGTTAKAPAKPLPAHDKTGHAMAKSLPTEKTLEGHKINVESGAFNFASAALGKVYTAKLLEIGKVLAAQPTTKIIVEGHTDAHGTAARNAVISQRRADRVKAVLVTAGVKDDRITAVGLSATRPVADNNTEEGRALNRRVEIRTIEAARLGTPAGQ